MDTRPTTSDFVTLKSGLILPLEPVRLALDLEDRGLELRVEGDSLSVAPRERITDEDRIEIRKWKWHLLAIVAESKQEKPQ